MSLSPRTLHRPLRERGMNFGTLLKKTRAELAMQYLRENKLSLTEIAFLLGYSEQSAFSRTYTPKQYQRVAMESPSNGG